MRGSAGPVRDRKAWAKTAIMSVALISVCGGAMAATTSRPPAPGAGSAGATAPAVWPAYLDGPLHQSYSPDATTITTAKVRRLVMKWKDTLGAPYLASPTVSDGSVFIGANTGWFYKLSISTGKVQAKRFLGQFPVNSCHTAGIENTATVASDPVTHKLTVYVGGPDGYVYALSAAHLAVQWKSSAVLPAPDYYQWSSPTVADSRVYIGVSSNCEQPQVRGGVIAFNQATGKKQAEFYAVPAGQLGGGVWSTVAVGPGGYVYATTGAGPSGDVRDGHSEAIVKLAPHTLKLDGSWQISGPAADYDTDFGASPVVFGKYVGACNKDGIFYAVSQATMKLAWQKRTGAVYNDTSGAECDGSPAFDGKYLYFASTGVTIHGVAYQGSVQKRKASNGKLLWESGLPEGVTGSPALDGAGVLAVGTYDNNASRDETYLVNAATGKILRTLVAGQDFAQSTFADDQLFTANANGVYGWAVK
jgi:outer membrane protein assembly factor BamB